MPDAGSAGGANVKPSGQVGSVRNLRQSPIEMSSSRRSSTCCPGRIHSTLLSAGTAFAGADTVSIIGWGYLQQRGVEASVGRGLLAESRYRGPRGCMQRGLRDCSDAMDGRAENMFVPAGDSISVVVPVRPSQSFQQSGGDWAIGVSPTTPARPSTSARRMSSLPSYSTNGHSREGSLVASIGIADGEEVPEWVLASESSFMR